MKQILVTVDDNQSLQNICNAINMLRGVVSTTFLPSRGSKQELQEAYVKESLTKALQEVRLAELEGRKLQSLDEFLDELDKKAS